MSDSYTFAAIVVLVVFVLAFAVSTNARMARMEALIAKELRPFWKRAQLEIGAILHHPHPRYAETDGLLEQLELLTITSEGRTRLEHLLQARAVDMHEDITEDQRRSAEIMLLVMKQVLAESANPTRPSASDVR